MFHFFFFLPQCHLQQCSYYVLSFSNVIPLRQTWRYWMYWKSGLVGESCFNGVLYLFDFSLWLYNDKNDWPLLSCPVEVCTIHVLDNAPKTVILNVLIQQVFTFTMNNWIKVRSHSFSILIRVLCQSDYYYYYFVDRVNILNDKIQCEFWPVFSGSDDGNIDIMSCILSHCNRLLSS